MAAKEKIVSREFPEYIRDPNPDVGLDESIKDLKPEQIEKTIMAVLGAQTARIRAVMETCIHCGLCSEACQWYLSSDKDPTFAPVAKMKMTAWEMLKRKGKVDAEFIKQTRADSLHRMQYLSSLQHVLSVRVGYHIYHRPGAADLFCSWGGAAAYDGPGPLTCDGAEPGVVYAE